MSATRPPSFDERYAAPVEASRRGAHRARPNPLTSSLPIVAGVAVVLLVVVGAWAVLGNRSDNSSGSTGTAAAAPSATAPASAGATPSASAAAPSASSSSSASPTGSASEGEVDRAVTVRVLNSTGVSGLAKKASGELKDKDWKIGKVGDANQKDLAVTTVYYADSDQEATAKAIVEDLGYGKVKKSATNAGTGITVVLGQDADDAN